MNISKTTRMIIIGIVSIGLLFLLIFGAIKTLGSRYKSNIDNEEFQKLNQQLNQQDYDVRRIRLETSDGRVIDIVQNGTLTRTDGDDSKQAILGFGKINQLLSKFTEEEIIDLYNSQSSSGNYHTITFETKSGNTYIIEIPVDGEDVPGELEELIEEIEETTETTLDPTPYPTYIPTPTPTPTPGATPTPTPAGSPTPTPTPIIFPTPTPTPGPTTLPAYMTAPPFDCSDYSLVKNTAISNTNCDPSP